MGVIDELKKHVVSSFSELPDIFSIKSGIINKLTKVVDTDKPHVNHNNPSFSSSIMALKMYFNLLPDHELLQRHVETHKRQMMRSRLNTQQHHLERLKYSRISTRDDFINTAHIQPESRNTFRSSLHDTLSLWEQNSEVEDSAPTDNLNLQNNEILLTIKHEHERNLLTVTLHRANILISSCKYVARIFAKVCLLPEKSQKQSSRSIAVDTELLWDEEFAFKKLTIGQLESCSIGIKLYSKGCFPKSHVLLGDSTVALGNVNLQDSQKTTIYFNQAVVKIKDKR